MRDSLRLKKSSLHVGGRRLVLTIVYMVLWLVPVVAVGQPTSLSISPREVNQGNCYRLTVGNGSGMTLDVRYRFNGGPTQYTSGWPTLDLAGRYTICTAANEALGERWVTGIRQFGTSTWLNTDAKVDIIPPPSLSLGVSPSSQSVGPGAGCREYTVSFTPLNNLCCIDAFVEAPPGVSVSPNYIWYYYLTGGTVSRTISACTTSSTTPGNKTIQVTAYGGEVVRTRNVTLTVLANVSLSSSYKLSDGFYQLQTTGLPNNSSVELRYRVDGGPEQVHNSGSQNTGTDGRLSFFHSPGASGLRGRFGRIRFTGLRQAGSSTWASTDVEIKVIRGCPFQGGIQQCDAQPAGTQSASELFRTAPTPMAEAEIRERLERTLRGYSLHSSDLTALRAEAEGTGRVSWVIDGVERELMLEPVELRAPSLMEAEIETTGFVAPSYSYKGWVRGYPASTVRLTLHPEMAMGFVEIAGERFFIEPLYRLVAGSAPGRTVVYRAEDVIDEAGVLCARNELEAHRHRLLLQSPATAAHVLDPGQAPPQRIPSQPRLEVMTEPSASELQASQGRVVRIAVQADAEYRALFPSTTAAESGIMAVLNMAQADFGTLGVMYNVVDLKVWNDAGTDPYDSCNLGGLWCELRDWYEFQSPITKDVGHLFSAKTVTYTFGSGSPVRVRGIGGADREEVGNIFSKPNEAYVLTTNYREADLFAHEQGHALGASHDNMSICPNGGRDPVRDCPQDLQDGNLVPLCPVACPDTDCGADSCPDTGLAGPIMCSSIQSTTTGFSDCTQQDVGDYLLAHP